MSHGLLLTGRDVRAARGDAIAYGVASLGLVATAWLASYLPSRRAATVDPVEALR